MNILKRTTTSENLVNLAGKSNDILSVFDRTIASLLSVNNKMEVEASTLAEHIVKLEEDLVHANTVINKNSKIVNKLNKFLND